MAKESAKSYLSLKLTELIWCENMKKFENVRWINPDCLHILVCYKPSELGFFSGDPCKVSLISTGFLSKRDSIFKVTCKPKNYHPSIYNPWVKKCLLPSCKSVCRLCTNKYHQLPQLIVLPWLDKIWANVCTYK